MKFSAIRVWHKLLFLGVIAAALCAVPTYLYILGADKEIREALIEVEGLAPATELVRLMKALQEHRGLAAAVLGGDRALVSMRATQEKEVTAVFTQVRAAVPPPPAPLAAQLDTVETVWKSLVTAMKDPAFPVEDSYNRHTKLVALTLNLLENTLDNFGLTLDPDATTYHLIKGAFIDVPKLTESMARLRTTGTAILGIKKAAAEERVGVASLLERTRETLELSRTRMLKVIGANGRAMEKFQAASASAHTETQKLVAVTDQEFMHSEVLHYNAADYLKLGATALDAQFKLIDAARGEIERILHERITAYQWTMAGLLGLLAALLLLGAAAMYWMTRSITRPLNAAITDANAIAAGRLDSAIHNSGRDEVGQLRGAMHYMQRNLAQIVFSIRENSESVATAAREIASSTQNMSARTESQASSLEQTAASMEALNTTFHKNDESSQHVSDLAAQAAEAAEQGGVVVGKVTHTMQEIDVSSRKIADIISVIDSIAFQTNILALNAAVEAARAGEQGRGFGVVASEVRALAQRSGQAAKEIRLLISESVKKVQTGTREAAESAKAMDDILASVRNVAVTMADMQTVRADQRLGVTQVSRAVEQMNQDTQQSAAMVEQIAATADLLSDQAQNLSKAVAAFKLSGEAGRRESDTPDTFQRNNHHARQDADTDADTFPDRDLSGKSMNRAQALPARAPRPMLTSVRDR